MCIPHSIPLLTKIYHRGIFFYYFNNQTIYIDMVKQMLIAGSGYGTRMSNAINKRHCKPLIYIFGRYLLDIQLDWAIRAGINNFCISVKPEDQKKVNTICAKYDANFVFRTGEKSFQEVPSLFEDVLDERFIFVGGHTPIPCDHLQKMINAADDYRYVVSAYNNTKNVIPKKKRIIIDRSHNPERYILIYDNDILPEKHYFLKNPYIIDKRVVKAVKKAAFEKTPLFYIFKEWERGSSVISVDNEFPVEFNTDEEFYRTKAFLSKCLKKHF